MKNTTGLQQGAKLVIISNTSGHNIAIGTKVKFKNYYPYGNNSNSLSHIQIMEYPNVYLCLSDIEIDECTIEDIQSELEDAEYILTKATQNCQNIKLKIEYLKETSTTKFDENEFKAYCTLKTLENENLSTMEKAKQIASLFNN